MSHFLVSAGRPGALLTRRLPATATVQASARCWNYGALIVGRAAFGPTAFDLYILGARDTRRFIGSITFAHDGRPTFFPTGVGTAIHLDERELP